MRSNQSELTSLQAAAAGALAAAVWGVAEPLDQKIFRCDYSDVALLGKAVTRSKYWWGVGFTIHVANGAVFVLGFRLLQRRLRMDPQRLAISVAVAEHLSLYPLCYFVDRYHPGRGEKGIPPLLTNPRAFTQATVRHAYFGALLGKLANRFSK